MNPVQVYHTPNQLPSIVTPREKATRVVKVALAAIICAAAGATVSLVFGASIAFSVVVGLTCAALNTLRMNKNANKNMITQENIVAAIDRMPLNLNQINSEKMVFINEGNPETVKELYKHLVIKMDHIENFKGDDTFADRIGVYNQLIRELNMFGGPRRQELVKILTPLPGKTGPNSQRYATKNRLKGLIKLLSTHEKEILHGYVELHKLAMNGYAGKKIDLYGVVASIQRNLTPTNNPEELGMCREIIEVLVENSDEIFNSVNK